MVLTNCTDSLLYYCDAITTTTDKLLLTVDQLELKVQNQDSMVDQLEPKAQNQDSPHENVKKVGECNSYGAGRQQEGLQYNGEAAG